MAVTLQAVFVCNTRIVRIQILLILKQEIDCCQKLLAQCIWTSQNLPNTMRSKPLFYKITFKGQLIQCPKQLLIEQVATERYALISINLKTLGLLLQLKDQ